MRSTGNNSWCRQTGLTLVELMVAMLIGLFLILGSITVYVQSLTSYRLSDGQSRLQENLRFAMDTLEPDIRLSEFWGRHSEPALVTVPVGLGVPCGGADATLVATNFAQAVTGIDESIGYAAAIPCPANTVARADSDVLVVRHVTPQQTAPAAGTLQIRSDLGISELFQGGANPGGYGPLAQTHDLVVNIYYVDSGSNLDPNLPSLRRWTLNPAGALVDEELIAGVENMQMQFGIDEAGNGSITRYLDSDNPAITPLTEILAVRLWLLMRVEQIEAGWVDQAIYTPLDGDLLPIVPGGANYPVNVRRQQITKTINLRNNRN
jgi:type IV pilus assembly protein PilW